MTISQTVERKYKNTKDKSLLFASDFSDYNQDYIGDLLSIYKEWANLSVWQMVST